MAKIVFDISAFQGKIYPENMDCDAVILRLGYTGYGSNKPALDDKFKTYYNQLTGKKPLGIYYFTLAYTDAMVDMETSWIIGQIKDLKLEYPVWVDCESQSRSAGWTALGKAERTRLMKRWMSNMKAAGYYTGIYLNLDWSRNKVDMSALSEFDVWIAQYYNRCTYTGPHGMWQKTSSAYVGTQHGVSSMGLDVSECYYDYPSLIREKGLNHLGGEVKPAQPTNKDYTIDDFRREVMEILEAQNCAEAFERTVTVSRVANYRCALVTPLERYFKAIGYYDGRIEADYGETPVFGKGMKSATEQYQREVVNAIPKFQDGIITRRGATWKKLLGV